MSNFEGHRQGYRLAIMNISNKLNEILQRKNAIQAEDIVDAINELNIYLYQEIEATSIEAQEAEQPDTESESLDELLAHLPQEMIEGAKIIMFKKNEGGM